MVSYLPTRNFHRLYSSHSSSLSLKSLIFRPPRPHVRNNPVHPPLNLRGENAVRTPQLRQNNNNEDKNSNSNNATTNIYRRADTQQRVLLRTALNSSSTYTQLLKQLLLCHDASSADFAAYKAPKNSFLPPYPPLTDAGLISFSHIDIFLWTQTHIHTLFYSIKVRSSIVWLLKYKCIEMISRKLSCCKWNVPGVYTKENKMKGDFDDVFP